MGRGDARGRARQTRDAAGEESERRRTWLASGRRRRARDMTAAGGVDAFGRAVECHRDRAIQIRSVDLFGNATKAGHRRRRRVAVGIAGARRHDRDPRLHGIEERLGAGRAGAVMGDLQEVDMGQSTGEERRVDRLLDVARQQERVSADLAEEHDRDVVDRRAAIGRMERHRARIRPQHPEIDVVDLQSIPGPERPARGPTGLPDDLFELATPRGVAGSGSDHARLEHPAHAVSLEQQRQAGDVVLVGMAQHERIDPAVPGRQPLVEGDQQPSGIRPAVDEESTAAATLHEDRITLPDVEDRDARRAIRAVDHGERHAEGRHDEQPDGDALSSRRPCMRRRGRSLEHG
jgi:hypothetical protein